MHNRQTGTYEVADGSEITDELFDFVIAVEQFKREQNCSFPTISNIFAVMKKLGYEKKDLTVAQT